MNLIASEGAVRIIPLGGCGEFGMNLTVLIFGDRLYVIDCGIMFPEIDKLGVDALLPYVDPLFSQFGGVYTYLITHGHEDHIGALPFLIQKWPAPVFAPPWAAALIQKKMQRLGLEKDIDLKIVKPGERVKTEDFEVDYIPVCHSIPHACSLYFRSPAARIFHSGDFKLTPQGPHEEQDVLANMKRLTAEGVDVLLVDSTNAHHEGICPGESTVVESMTNIMQEADGAVLITTFASNLWRIMAIAQCCEKAGRKLLVLGTGLETSIQIAKDLNLYTPPQGLFISAAESRTIPRDKLTVLATGSQGEKRSALARIAQDAHGDFSIVAGDSVIFSSRNIPGNERSVHYIMSDLERLGARVISARQHPGLHVSGHAFGGEVTKLVETLRPKYVVPVHGMYSHLLANSRNAEEPVPEPECLLVSDGEILEFKDDKLESVGLLEIEYEYVDAESRLLIPKDTLRERLRIGEKGLVVCNGTFDTAAKEWVVMPEVITMGVAFPLGFDQESWQEKLVNALDRLVQQNAKSAKSEQEDIREEVRLLTRKNFFELTGKKPVVLSLIDIL